MEIREQEQEQRPWVWCEVVSGWDAASARPLVGGFRDLLEFPWANSGTLNLIVHGRS